MSHAFRVLIVEDESMVAMALEDMLTELGCEVVGIASRLSQAIDLARDAKFDVAILDVNLNGEPSYSVAEALLGRKIPFVFTTGYGRQGISPDFREAIILSKPFSQTELSECLERVGMRRS